jgi:type I restriction enzyme M protein
MSNHNEISSFIWNVCDDVLRGLFKQHEYGDVILPFVVLRRLDCVLEGKKDEILKIHEEYKDKFDDTSKIIHSKLNLKFSNYSQYDLRRLKDEPNKLSENFYDYLSSFSTNVQDIIKNFGLQKHIDKLDSNDKLYLLIEKFTDIDLHPSTVDNHVMGNIFEELLRKFSEMSNETSGEHYTPRDVVKLLVSLVFSTDKEKLSDPNKIISVYDPCCGTGGMLTIGKDWVHCMLSNKSGLFQI